MTYLKSIWTTFFLTILSLIVSATTWAPVYPYDQTTEGGKVKCHSIPFGGYDGPYGPGQTFVYADNKLLYSIDKYFSNWFFTSNNGEYLIEFDFYLFYMQPMGFFDDSGKVTVEPIIYDGDAVNIYKHGELLKTIKFSELGIDTSKIFMNDAGQWFSWYYKNDTTANPLKMRMNNNPAFLEDDKLFLITADNQLCGIEISSGQISVRQNAFEALNSKANWTPTEVKRKYKKVKYPEKFLLPKLQNGKTIEQGLSELLNKKPSEDERGSAVIQIYFHTLLINKQGKCEIVYVSPSKRTDFKKDFMSVGDDKELKATIESWIKEQTFSTKTFPKKFPKFKYTDFVYLK